jgi:hypothetical protein
MTRHSKAPTSALIIAVSPLAPAECSSDSGAPDGGPLDRILGRYVIALALEGHR